VFVWHSIDRRENLKSVLLTLPADYVDPNVVSLLSSGLSTNVRGLLVEEGYVDKDYRSVYYNFYAKKSIKYRRNCIRLHLFTDEVRMNNVCSGLQLEDGTSTDYDGMDDALSEEYLGFIVLRPTYRNNIGRSVISPRALDVTGDIIKSEHKVHILGHRLKAVGFPWMMQHTDISVCSHVACWSILRHYSERYSKYAEFLLHDITKMAQPVDVGGLIPSIGLKGEHAERIFLAAGTYPMLIERASSKESFDRQMLAYLESGFPLMAILPARRHAVTVVGVRWKAGYRPELQAPGSAFGMVEALLASDDTQLPYVSIRAGERESQSAYMISEIESFIVALPDKIFLPALQVDRLALWAREAVHEFRFPDAGDCVIRYYVTTVAALRRDFRERIAHYDPLLVERVLQLPMSQFVWIVEYSSTRQWDREQIAVRLIVDATASGVDNTPILAMFDSCLAAVLDDKSGAELETEEFELEPADEVGYRRVRSNLDRYLDASPI